MKPGPFDYRAPRALGEAVELLAPTGGTSTRVLAGGQSLIPLMNRRLVSPDVIVDVGRIAEGRMLERSDGRLRIGLGVTQAALMAASGLAGFNRLLARALPWVGFPQTRTRGTVVGSVAHADPAAEIPAALAALDGVIELRSARGTRSLPVAQFVTGAHATAIAADELATAVEVRGLDASERVAFLEVSRRIGCPAIAGVAAVGRRAADGSLDRVRIVAFGAVDRPTRLAGAEVAALQAPDPGDVGAAVLDWSLGLRADVHASADLRRAQLAALAERAVALLRADSPDDAA
jgi:CO/xanthine dehydrogenase FAD-binding subunit